MGWYAVWNYANAFWTTVVLGCIQPVNWEYCLPVQDWLFPALIDYVEFRTTEPYSKEKEALQNVTVINESNETFLSE